MLQFSSVTQSCTTLCDPMNCSTPGLPVVLIISSSGEGGDVDGRFMEGEGMTEGNNLISFAHYCSFYFSRTGLLNVP